MKSLFRIPALCRLSRFCGALAAATLALLPVSSPAAAFTAGNLAIIQAEASANNTTASVVELDTTTAGQTGVQTLAIDGSTNRVSGSASSTLYLSRSADGTLVVLTAHNNTSTSANANTLNPREVITFDVAGAFKQQTTYTGTSGNQTRSATSLDNTNWFVADQGGLYSNGTSAASPSGNFRSIRSFGGVVYVFTASASIPPVGTLSATTGSTFTALPGLANGTTTRQDFYLISSGSNGTAYDVLYVLDSTSNTAGTILKYSLVSGSWTANGSYTTTFGGFGLCAATNSGGAVLYVTTGQGALTANSVVKVTDTAGYNTTINVITGNNVTLYTAPTGKLVKGIDFAPVAVPQAPLNERLVITEIQSSQAAASVNDYWELSNVGSTAVNLSNWKWNDSARVTTGSAVTIPAGTTIAPGESIIFTALTPTAFRTWWSIPSTVQVISTGVAPGLGSSDAVSLFTDAGVEVCYLSYAASGFTRSNGSAALGGHAGASGGGSATAGLVLDPTFGTTVAGRRYTAATVGTFGAFASSASGADIGSPGVNAVSGTAPIINTPPSGQSITSGATATLTVVATGTPAPSLQWYQGNSGDTSIPMAGATGASFTTPTLAVTTTYWVRAFNSAGIANSTAATVSVGFAAPHTSADINITVPNTGDWNPAGVTVNGTTFVNLGLQGMGRFPASAIDPATGESIGSVSDMQITGWKKNADGSYTGRLNTLPDRGFNNAVIFSNYGARINAFDFTFTPYTSATPTTLQNQVALTFAGSTRFTYDRSGTPTFTTGLLANDTISLFGVPVPAAAVSSTQSDGAVPKRLTIDSEGLILDTRTGKAGSGWVSDEYGPYIYHFNSAKQLDGQVQLPAAILPHAPAGTVSFVDTNVNGRRTNQGMEGIAQSPDGTRLFGLMQSATLQDSGSGNQGRFNTRLMVYDISSTDTPTDPVKQYVIQLPRIDSTGSTSNGSTVDRTGAQSSILALNDHQLLILARDGNGRGVTGSPVFKSILLADLSTATDIDGAYDAEGAAVAPNGVLNVAVTPIPWTEALNMIGKLGSASAEVAKFNLNLHDGVGSDTNSICEKWEAIALVSANDSSNPNDYFLFVGNDNDFLTGSGKYLDENGVLQSYDGGLENDTLVLVWRVRLTGSFNQAPFAANAIPNQTITAGTPFSFTFAANTFSDPESQTLTYTATKADDTALPVWLSFNPATRTFSGTPGQSDAVSLQVKVKATDNGTPNLSGSTTFKLAPAATSGVDLSTYVRVGRYNLPEPTRTTPPDGRSLLAQEASGVTYDWDTDTLFVTADGGTSIVQVSKTGQLINSMTLGAGSSPQGGDFYDQEGITYIGNGQFVMSEERDRQLVLFTYAAGTTLTRAQTKTVKIGTFVQNIGTEGLSWDPLTGGYIVLKEIDPMGIFQTTVDFNAGTASNGSPTTENSVNLFDPALTGLLDVADVFALSNIPALSGTEDYSHMLLLSQESAKILNIGRDGTIYSSLQIVSDPGNPLSAPAQQHEGITMDRDGFIYVVNENGGGDADHPQLWVYAPTTGPNQAPSAVALNNAVVSLPENSSISSNMKVADIIVTDEGLGVNNLSLTGTDAACFVINNGALYLKAGTVLDFETKSSYSVTINVDDSTVGTTPDATTTYTLTVTDVVNEGSSSGPTLIISEVAPWSSGNSPVGADWFEVTNPGTNAVNITGWKVDDSSASFASALALNGITSIAPGESVIFIETADLPTTKAAFLNNWFGANPPAGLQIGSYTGSGIGLSTGGDGVNLYDANGVLQASVSFGSSPATAPYATFDNAGGANNAALTQLSVVGLYGAFVAANSASEIGSPGTTGKLIISEVAPWSSSSPVGADWFEVSNTGATPVNISGWKVDDSSESFAAALALNGITTIAPGESVIFMETADLPTAKAAFLNTWFGANPPAGLQIGSYSGSGIGLSTSGDAVVLYDSGGRLRAKVSFASSPAGPSLPTFDNAVGLNNTAISQLSAVGRYGAFAAKNDANEIGSPGSTGNLIISEVAPWSSGNSPVGADWFEVSNTGARTVNIAGWKVDDSSAVFASALALNGITNIAPGESVIFMETADLPTTKAVFLNTWFGANPPSNLQIGSYTGSGIGLSTGGDAVNLYNSNGVLQASVTFGSAPANAPFGTFDNSTGLNNVTIAQLSIVGRYGAFVAANDATEIGSPGTTKTVPIVTLTSPLNNALIGVPTSVLVQATASKFGGSIASVEFYLDGTLKETVTVQPYEASITVATPGARTFMAVAVDNLGLRATNSVSVTANDLPMVTLVPLGQVAFAAPATMLLQANVSDADGSITSVKFYANDTLLATVTAPPYQFNWQSVPVGSYFLTVKAEDNRGGVTSSTAQHIIVGPVGITAPTRTETGAFRFQLVGTISGKTHLIQVSTDFVNWTTIGTVTPGSNTLDVEDPDANGNALRFYRVVQQNQ